MGVPPNHPFLDRIFHWKPSILGYSHDYGNPHIANWCFSGVYRQSFHRWRGTFLWTGFRYWNGRVEVTLNNFGNRGRRNIGDLTNILHLSPPKLTLLHPLPLGLEVVRFNHRCFGASPRDTYFSIAKLDRSGQCVGCVAQLLNRGGPKSKPPISGPSKVASAAISHRPSIASSHETKDCGGIVIIPTTGSFPHIQATSICWAQGMFSAVMLAQQTSGTPPTLRLCHAALKKSERLSLNWCSGSGSGPR